MKLSDLKNELNNEKQLTENWATGYKTSGHALLDINYKTSSLRNCGEGQIIDLFVDAFNENKLLALKWLFFLRDARGGMGERRAFRVILRYLANCHPCIVEALMDLIPEYGRYDDLWGLLDTDLRYSLIHYIQKRLLLDCALMEAGSNVSLLAKWLPSATTSSKESRKYASMIYHDLNLSKTEYRKMLKKLRDYIDVVESKMSRNEWSDIEYSQVPSKANILYRNAFMRHDKERRTEYLESLQKGETKINSSVNYPHDIVHAYGVSVPPYWLRKSNDTSTKVDETLEQLWKSLPDYGSLDEGTIVVADGSGSMTVRVGNSKVEALEVANSLAIYFSERLKGEFKDKYITFSENPRLVDLSKCSTLRDKIAEALRHSEVANTNIYRVFKLIIDVAIKNKYSQEDLPKSILILSDMEFDCGTEGCDQTLFEAISEEYEKHGYKLPRLVFWNLCSRTGTIPIKENPLGVALVSGFSPAITDMVLSGELDPYKCLVDKLNSDRYAPVEEALEGVDW